MVQILKKIQEKEQFILLILGHKLPNYNKERANQN